MIISIYVIALTFAAVLIVLFAQMISFKKFEIIKKLDLPLQSLLSSCSEKELKKARLTANLQRVIYCNYKPFTYSRYVYKSTDLNSATLSIRSRNSITHLKILITYLAIFVLYLLFLRLATVHICSESIFSILEANSYVIFISSYMLLSTLTVTGNWLFYMYFIKRTKEYVKTQEYEKDIQPKN